MRRFWLSLLTAFALAAGGAASASAPACAMMGQAQMAPAEMAAPAHDCCPDDKPSGERQAPQDHKMDGCLMGSACGVAQAVTPSVESSAAVEFVAVKQPLLNEIRAPLGLLQEHFRPPRSI